MVMGMDALLYFCVFSVPAIHANHWYSHQTLVQICDFSWTCSNYCSCTIRIKAFYFNLMLKGSGAQARLCQQRLIIALFEARVNLSL